MHSSLEEDFTSKLHLKCSPALLGSPQGHLSGWWANLPLPHQQWSDRQRGQRRRVKPAGPVCPVSASSTPAPLPTSYVLAPTRARQPHCANPPSPLSCVPGLLSLWLFMLGCSAQPVSQPARHQGEMDLAFHLFSLRAGHQMPLLGFPVRFLSPSFGFPAPPSASARLSLCFLPCS